MSHLTNPQRRLLLKTLTAASAAGLVPLHALQAAQQAVTKKLHWRNWANDQEAYPSRMEFPANEEALRELLLNSEGTVRVFGGSHSFSPLVPTKGMLISIEQFHGLRHYNNETNTATFGAGTRLAMASRQAYDAGQSFINEPDVNMQSLAGAISTSTHGTGLTLPSLSGQVKALRLMTPDGEIHQLDESNPKLLHAAQVSVGALGVITEVTFQNAPAYRLEETTRVTSIKEAMDIIDREKDTHRNVEFFAFPFGNKAIIKTLDITDKPNTELKPDDSNETLEMACEVSMRAGWLIPAIQKLLGFFIDEETRRGPSNQIYAADRNVGFHEMEYTVTADKGLEVLEEVMHAMRKSGENVFFPIEYRYVAADEAWLSPFYRQAGAAISVHQYYKQDYKPLFDKVEPVFKRHQGRPHWGKLNTMTPVEARQRYERYDDFIAIQKDMDPQGRMLNSYLRHMFGAIT